MQEAKIGDTGRQRHRADLHGVRPDERAAGSPSPRRPVGPDDGRILPRHDRGRHAAVRRQHLPLLASRFGSVRAARSYAVRGGLPADAGHRMGALQERITSTKRAPSPRCRPCTCRPTIRPTPRRRRRSATSTRSSTSNVDLGKGYLPGGRSAGLVEPHSRSAVVGERHYAVPAACRDPAALPRTAGHHRDSRRRRTEPKKTSWSCIVPAASSASCRSRSSWPKSFTGKKGRDHPARRHDPQLRRTLRRQVGSPARRRLHVRRCDRRSRRAGQEDGSWLMPVASEFDQQRPPGSNWAVVSFGTVALAKTEISAVESKRR
jgi:hypothetical protein